MSGHLDRLGLASTDSATERAKDIATVRRAMRRMVDALDALESWDEELGSRSISEEVWAARDDLKQLLEADSS